MPMDGLMLSFVTRELEETLIGGRVDKVTQPEPETVILALRSRNTNYRLLLSAHPVSARCHLTRAAFTNPPEPPVFCMLMRKHLSGSRLKAIRQIDGDRQIRFIFDGTDEMGENVERALILEIMGRHSNLILTADSGRILDAIKRVNGHMSRVREVLPGLIYMPPPAQQKTAPGLITAEAAHAFLASGTGSVAKALGAHISGLSAPTCEEWAYRLTGNDGALLEQTLPGPLADRLAALAAKVLSQKPPVIQMNREGDALDVYPFPYTVFDTEQQRSYDTVSEALEAFYTARSAKERVTQKAGALARGIKTHIERCERKLILQDEDIANAAKMDAYRRMGELITAHLYHIRKGQDTAVLDNIYETGGGSVRIPLDTALTPAQNAQRYFTRYRKARAACEAARVQKEKTERELVFLESALDDLGKCTEEAELEEIRQELETAGYVRRPSRRNARKFPASQPYTYTSGDGIRILVGKNGAQNDRLTAAAGGEETWLHAHEMPGSHVIIKHGGPPPERTLLEAAQLAAYYSKGRLSSSVPVDYTYRRHVKKPGGSPAGFAVYTGHRTLFVTVTQNDIRRMAVDNP